MNKPKAGTRKTTRPRLSDEQKLARLVEGLIDKGANTAEEIHRAVSDLPVSVLESLGMEETAEDVKKIQDSSIGAIYELIHDVNHKVADLAADLLKQRTGKKKT